MQIIIHIIINYSLYININMHIYNISKLTDIIKIYYPKFLDTAVSIYNKSKIRNLIKILISFSSVANNLKNLFTLNS